MTVAKTIFVNAIRENDRLESVFLVKHKALQVGKTGKSYLNVILTDKTGDIEARVWDNADEVAAKFDRDDFVTVQGRGQGFQGRVQLNLFSCEKCDAATLKLADFVASTTKDVDAMFDELRAIVLGVSDPFLRALLGAFVDDPDLAWRIKAAPAARSMHHPFAGGLLEHTLSALKLMGHVARHYANEGYAEINPDLLIAGTFLHDIGKTRELSYGRTIDYSDSGRLLGHLVIGVEMVNERAAKIPGFPEELRMLVNHMIVAHHAELEYGSPKRPKTLEAFIVHQIDDLDAKVNSFARHMRQGGESDRWTTYNKMWDRFLYKHSWVSGASADADDALRVPLGAGGGSEDPTGS